MGCDHLFDTGEVHDDPDHWNELADRIVATAVRRSNQSSFDWLTQSRPGWVAATCALILMLVSALLGFRQPPAANGPGEWVQALTPTDDVGKEIMLPDRPPAIGTLLFGPGRPVK